MRLKDAAVAGINVRAAKAHLSAILEWVAGGHEMIITSDGKPKAKLVSVSGAKLRKTFSGMGAFLSRQPVHGGATADQLIDEDRDGRGW